MSQMFVSAAVTTGRNTAGGWTHWTELQMEAGRRQLDPSPSCYKPTLGRSRADPEMQPQKKTSVNIKTLFRRKQAYISKSIRTGPSPTRVMDLSDALVSDQDQNSETRRTEDIYNCGFWVSTYFWPYILHLYYCSVSCDHCGTQRTVLAGQQWGFSVQNQVTSPTESDWMSLELF